MSADSMRHLPKHPARHNTEDTDGGNILLCSACPQQQLQQQDTHAAADGRKDVGPLHEGSNR